MTKLFAMFGLYVIVLYRMTGGHGSTNSFTTSILEMAGVTVVFVVVTIWLLTRKSRAKASLEELDE